MTVYFILYFVLIIYIIFSPFFCRMDRDGSLNISFDEWRDYLMYAPCTNIHELIKYWRHSTVSRTTTLMLVLMDPGAHSSSEKVYFTMEISWRRRRHVILQWSGTTFSLATVALAVCVCIILVSHCLGWCLCRARYREVSRARHFTTPRPRLCAVAAPRSGPVMRLSG